MPQNASIVLQAQTAPEGICPTSFQDTVNKVAQYLSGYLPGNFSSFSYSASQPTVDNQTIPWIRLGSSGEIEGIYSFVNGAWVRKHEIAAGPNSYRAMWVGSLASLETFDGGAAGAVTATTGPMWEQDTDFTDKIPIGAGANAAVGANASQLSSGSSATDQVRGAYIIKRTARIYRTA